MSCERTSRRGFTLAELLVVMVVIMTLIMLLLPAVQQAREAARRYQCQNNLAQLSLAIQNYEMAFRMLPPGTVNATGPIVNRVSPNAYHVSWIVAILPHMEASRVYRQFDFRYGVYHHRNNGVISQPLPTLTCPSGTTSYAACHAGGEVPIDVDNDGCFFLNSHIGWDDVTDGRAHTIAVGESMGMGSVWGWSSGTRDTLRNTGSPPNAPSSFPEGMVVELDFTGMAGEAGWNAMLGEEETAADRRDPVLLKVGGFGSQHAGGAQFAMCDGSIRFIADQIDIDLYRNLGSRNDGAMPERF